MPGGLAKFEDSKPRGKMTAYAFFVQTCREEYKKKHPDEQVDFAEFSKKCAERWKTMTDKEKKRFNQMAESDKRRYELEMGSYVPPNMVQQGKKGRKVKKMKDPNAPKRAMSGFFFFSGEGRGKVKAANPDFSIGDVAKELGRRWSELDDVSKQRYEAMAEKDRERYESEKAAYQEQLKNGSALNDSNDMDD